MRADISCAKQGCIWEGAKEKVFKQAGGGAAEGRGTEGTSAVKKSYLAPWKLPGPCTGSAAPTPRNEWDGISSIDN